MIVLVFFVQRLSEKLSCQKCAIAWQQIRPSASGLQFLVQKVQQGIILSVLNKMGASPPQRDAEGTRATCEMVKGRDGQAGSPGWWDERQAGADSRLCTWRNWWRKSCSVLLV